MNRLSIYFLILFVTGIPLNSIGADRLFITGVDTTSESSNYAFMGALLPLPDNSLAHGFVIHLWTDYLEYSYDSWPSRISAKANSISVALAYHDSGDGYWWNAKAGASHANTRLTPDDPGNNSRGAVNDLKLGLAGEYNINPDYKINGILDYGVDRESYWSRLRILGRLHENMFTGPEVIYMGDPSYDIQQFGWAIEGIPVFEQSSIGIKGGIRKDDGSTSRYIGIDLVVFF